MRIIILQRYLSGWRGGVRVTIQVARCLSSTGHHVTLLGRRSSQQEHFYYSLPEPVQSILWKTDVAHSKSGQTERLLTEFNEILESLPQADLMIASNCFDALAVANVEIPRIYYVQALEADFYQSDPFKQELAERSYQQKSRFIASSQYVRQELSNRYGVECSEVISPAVEEVFLAAGKDRVRQHSDFSYRRIRVLYVGATTTAKGFDDLIAALKILQEAGLKTSLDVVTQEPIRTDGLDGVETSFHKPYGDPELADLYKSVDVLVYPSHREAFGLVPLEAMACATPTVLSDSGGIHQYAQTGINTLVVPCSSPRALADAIQKLMMDVTLSARIILNGILTARRFSIAAMCGSWEKAIEKAMS